MIVYSIQIDKDFCRSITNYIKSIKSSELNNFFEFLIIVPDYKLALNLKRSFDDATILPRIKTLDQIFESNAILSGKFQYIEFITKSVIEVYKILGDGKGFFSMRVANRIFNLIQNGQNLDNEFFEYIKEIFHTDYETFQKNTIDEIFTKNSKVIVAGFYPENLTVEYLLNSALKNNKILFFYGLPKGLDCDQNNFFYKLQKFLHNVEVQYIGDENLSLKNVEIFPVNTSVNRKRILLIHCINEYEMIQNVRDCILKAFPDVALITNNTALVQKLEHRLARYNISVIAKKQMKDHLDIIFLNYILDLYLFPNSGKFLIQLLRHPYIFQNNAELVDNIEVQYLRTLKLEKNTNLELVVIKKEERDFILQLKKCLRFFNGTQNFAKAHLECAENLSQHFSYMGKKILRLISEQEIYIPNLEEYKYVFNFFAENDYYYDVELFKNKIRVLKPEEAGFLTENNIILADFTEKDFNSANIKIMYNLFQILHTKKTFIVYNQEELLSRVLLKMQDVFKPEYKENNFHTPSVRKAVEETSFQILPQHMPKILTATMIELFLNDPYEFHLRYILKIKEPDPIDKKPGYAEFGNILHRVMQNCLNSEISKAYLVEIFEKEAQKYYKSFTYVKNLWLSRFKKMADSFVPFYNEKLQNIECIETEKEYSTNLHGFVIKARFDRVEFLKDGSVSVIDFKTGRVPTLKNIEKFIKPQLLVQGLILQDAIKAQVSSLAYCKLGTEKVKVHKVKDPNSIILAFREKLNQTLQKFVA